MAKVLGESGRYVTQEAARKRRRIILVGFVVVGVLGVLEGLVLSTVVPLGHLPLGAKVLVQLLVLVGVILVYHVGSNRTNALEKERLFMLRGAGGETLVGSKLENFPDDFCVINDLTTPFGNLDHVVVGPTGVFVLDSKNWRGQVSADGKGELLLNGKPTDKPFIRQFVARMLGIRDRVRALAPGVDPYYQAVFVFTSARVDANWGATGSVHCIREDQLHDYIVENEFGKRLTPAQVQTVAQAFLGLAHMDREFGNTRPAS